MKENANRSNLVMLKQISDSMDNQMKDINQLAYEISFSPKLQLLLNPTYDKNSYTYFEFLNELKGYRISKRAVYDYYVYLPKEDTVITPSAKMDSELFYRYYYRYEKMNVRQWRKRLEQTKELYTFLPSMKVFEGELPKYERVVTYVQPLPYGETIQKRGILVMMINEEQIKTMFQTIEWANKGDIYLLDKDNKRLMTTAQKALPLDSMESRLNGEYGLFEQAVGGEKMMVSYIISKDTGWKYVSIVPKSVFMQKVNKIKTWGISTVIICLIASLLTAYMLAYRHYVPVRDLVQSIVRNKSEKGSNKYNEYHFIKETLTDTWDVQKQLQDVITEQIPTVKANFLSRALQGLVDSSAAHSDSLKFMGITFTTDTFVVLVIDVDDCSRVLQDAQEIQWAKIRFIITNSCEELVNEHYHSYTVELDRDRLALLINLKSEKNGQRKDTLDTIAKALKEIVEERLHLTISMGIGNECNGLEDVGKSYREALQALEYRMIKGRSQITYFDEIQNMEEHYYYPIDMELQLINFIKSADFENASKILDNVFKINFESRNISLQLGKCLFFNIMSTLVKLFNEINIQYETVFPEGDPVQQLVRCNTAEEMHQRIREIFQTLCSYMTENRNDRGSQLLEDIMNTINESYTDSMLSLTVIAEKLNITPQYLSSFFKKQSGMNLLDYVGRVRVDHAKDLLKDCSLTISEVAQRIGYANDAGLIRIFKKYEGITPGKYRTIQQSDKKMIK